MYKIIAGVVEYDAWEGQVFRDSPNNNVPTLKMNAEVFNKLEAVLVYHNNMSGSLLSIYMEIVHVNQVRPHNKPDWLERRPAVI